MNDKPWAAYGCEELDRGLGGLTSGVAVQVGARTRRPNPEDPFDEEAAGVACAAEEELT